MCVLPSSADPSLRTEGAVAVHVQALGHVVLKVRDLQRSEGFYSGTLGMRVISRNADPPMTFFSLETTENHHDFALMEVCPSASSTTDPATGLAHVAFKVGSSTEEFELARTLLEGSGCKILYEAERGFSRSVHVLDPDGNEIELYVDVSDA